VRTEFPNDFKRRNSKHNNPLEKSKKRMKILSIIRGLSSQKTAHSSFMSKDISKMLRKAGQQSGLEI